MRSRQHYDQVRLLNLLAGDSELALRDICEHYKDVIYSIALRYLKVPVIAEEVVQDVFLKLWLHRKDLKQLTSIDAWIITVTKNLISNYLRKLAREALCAKISSSPTPTDNADSLIRKHELDNAFQNALDQLSPQQKIIYQLSRRDGMTYVEIAEKLNLSPLTVKTHLSRAHNSLRSYLSGFGEFVLVLFLLQS